MTVFATNAGLNRIAEELSCVLNHIEGETRVNTLLVTSSATFFFRTGREVQDIVVVGIGLAFGIDYLAATSS